MYVQCIDIHEAIPVMKLPPHAASNMDAWVLRTHQRMEVHLIHSKKWFLTIRNILLNGIENNHLSANGTLALSALW